MSRRLHATCEQDSIPSHERVYSLEHFTRPMDRYVTILLSLFSPAFAAILTSVVHLAGVMLSTAAAPESFNDFHNSSGGDQLVVGYYQGTGTSGLCVRVNANEAGIPGIQDGSNVTLQMVFNGGDGILYQVSRNELLLALSGAGEDVLTWVLQCMDLTLDANYTIPSNITCTNPQGAPPSSNGTGTTPPATPSSKGGAISVDVNGLLGLGLAGVLAAILV